MKHRKPRGLNISQYYTDYFSSVHASAEEDNQGKYLSIQAEGSLKQMRKLYVWLSKAIKYLEGK